MSVRVLMELKAELKSPDGILAEGVGSSGCVTAVGSASVMHLLTAQASRLLVELHETVGLDVVQERLWVSSTVAGVYQEVIS